MRHDQDFNLNLGLKLNLRFIIKNLNPKIYFIF